MKETIIKITENEIITEVKNDEKSTTVTVLKNGIQLKSEDVKIVNVESNILSQKIDSLQLQINQLKVGNDNFTTNSQEKVDELAKEISDIKAKLSNIY